MSDPPERPMPERSHTLLGHPPSMPPPAAMGGRRSRRRFEPAQSKHLPKLVRASSDDSSPTPVKPIPALDLGALLPLPVLEVGDPTPSGSSEAPSSPPASARSGGNTDHVEEIEPDRVSVPPGQTSGPPTDGSADIQVIVDTAPTPPRPPPPSPSQSGVAKRPRAWWDDLYEGDMLRTLDHPTREDIARDSDFIERALSVQKDASILDLACGFGQHAVELASRGYAVTALDLSGSMLARAAREAETRGQKVTLLQGDMRDLSFDSMFDAIYCFHSSFGFFEDDTNLKILERIHKALRSGGAFLLDVANRDYVAPRVPSMAWFEARGCTCMDEATFDWLTSRLRVKRTVIMEQGGARELEFGMRLYSLNELGCLLNDVGFRVTEISGHLAHPGAFFGYESSRIIFLAEKR